MNLFEARPVKNLDRYYDTATRADSNQSFERRVVPAVREHLAVHTESRWTHNKISSKQSIITLVLGHL